jgi:hypothetical protein
MIYTIYKISIAGEDYIGSTRDLKQRKGSHKSSCNNPNDSKYEMAFYQTIRDNGGWDCCVITPVEEFECETNRQAECREEYWRREYKALLNGKRAFRTETDLKADEIKRSVIRRGNKTNCECGVEYNDTTKAHHLKSKRHQKFINQDDTPLL